MYQNNLSRQLTHSNLRFWSTYIHIWKISLLLWKGNIWNKSIKMSLKCSLHSIPFAFTYTSFEIHWSLEKRNKSDLKFWIYIKNCVLTPSPEPAHTGELIEYEIHFWWNQLVSSLRKVKLWERNLQEFVWDTNQMIYIINTLLVAFKLICLELSF